ncbi:MAG: hypothetical protein MZV64_01565 [Ignavibacteriales bacterium]|nr:hypothetical protein [Ignavibacteriales bacterium]
MTAFDTWKMKRTWVLSVPGTKAFRSAGANTFHLMMPMTFRSFKLEQQVNYLENNPEIGICGTFYQLIDQEGNPGEKITLPKSMGRCGADGQVHKPLL